MTSIRSVGRRSSLNIGSPEPNRPRSAERSIRQHNDGGRHLEFEQEDEEKEKATGRERLPSDSSFTMRVKTHRRVMSDPFDNADVDASATGYDHRLLDEGQFALPTLHRFPFAETSNRNCWSEPPVNIFSVRGPGYLSDKKKITAQKYLLAARGCDLFLSDKPSECDVER